MRRTLLALGFILAACGGDDGDGQVVEAPDVAPQCDELWAEGADTDTAIDVGDEQGCLDADGELLYVGNANEECADGSTLYWNDEGWGYSGDTWHQHAGADKVAPEEERTACTG